MQEFDKLDFKLEKESFNKSVVFINSKNIKINDDILFDQITNLKKIVKSKKNEELFGKSCSSKICDFFAANSNILSYSEILKIAQYFFAISGHNANCERISSLINTKWSDERNKMKLSTVKNILTVQFNFKHLSCLHLYGKKLLIW